MQVSFIVVTYQRGELLQQCLDSIYAQEGLPRPFEVIVIDNGGDAVIRTPRDALIEMRVELPGKNLGAVGGRNLGMSIAKGEHFIFVDDDAEWHTPTDAANLISHLNYDPSCGAVAVKSLDTAGNIIRTEMPHPNKEYITGVSQPVEVPYFYTMGLALRAEVYRRVGGYPLRFGIYMEEVDLSLRLLDAGFHILYDPQVAVYHHRSQQGRSIRGSKYWQQNSLNKARLAWRLLPYPYPVTTLLIWSAAMLLKTGDPRLVFQVWRTLWDEHRLLAEERRPIRPETVRYLNRIGARLWY